MEQYRIKITDLAESDLESAGNYIAYELLNPDAAVNTVQGIRKQIHKLNNFPQRNDLEDLYLAAMGVRKTNYKKYKIYYIVDEIENIVYIVRILHRLVDSRIMSYRTLKINI